MSGAEDRRDRIEVRVAEDPDDRQFVPRWRELQAEAGKAGAAIAVRPEGLLEDRVANGEAVLAFLDGEFVGAGYLKTWEDGRFLSQSGVVVDPKARRMGIASAIKAKVMEVSRRNHPNAAYVSLTLSPTIEKMNRALGFDDVPYADLPQGDDFWEGCKTCPFYETLVANKRVTCNCVALRLDPGHEGGETAAP